MPEEGQNICSSLKQYTEIMESSAEVLSSSGPPGQVLKSWELKAFGLTSSYIFAVQGDYVGFTIGNGDKLSYCQLAGRARLKFSFSPFPVLNPFKESLGR